MTGSDNMDSNSMNGLSLDNAVKDNTGIIALGWVTNEEESVNVATGTVCETLVHDIPLPSTSQSKSGDIIPAIGDQTSYSCESTLKGDHKRLIHHMDSETDKRIKNADEEVAGPVNAIAISDNRKPLPDLYRIKHFGSTNSIFCSSPQVIPTFTSLPTMNPSISPLTTYVEDFSDMPFSQTSLPDMSFSETSLSDNLVSLDPTLKLNYETVLSEQRSLLAQFSANANQPGPPLPSQYLFKPMPKYKVIKRLLNPRVIGSISDVGFSVNFQLNSSDFGLNTASLGAGLHHILDQNSYQIQLRFCYINDILETHQKDSFTEYLCIECNGNRVFTASQTTNIETDSYPFDLSQWCVLGVNTIHIWLSKAQYIFLLPCLFEVSIVRYETPDSLLTKLKQNLSQYLASETTMTLIKARSEVQTDDDDIVMSVMNTKVKLYCPISFKRLETPCRTINCKHIECFDGLSFFTANDLRYHWLCPICQNVAHFEALRIDGYFAKIMKAIDKDIMEVSINADSSYEVVNDMLLFDTHKVIKQEKVANGCDSNNGQPDPRLLDQDD